MFVTYIIYSTKLDRFYIGYTSDLDKRLAEHNSGLSHFTSKANDWVLKYHMHFDSRNEASSMRFLLKRKKAESLFSSSSKTFREAPKAFGEEVIGFDSDMLHHYPMFVTYNIYSTKLDRFYIGYTLDFDKRLTEHNRPFPLHLQSQ